MSTQSLALITSEWKMNITLNKRQIRYADLNKRNQQDSHVNSFVYNLDNA